MNPRAQEPEVAGHELRGQVERLAELPPSCDARVDGSRHLLDGLEQPARIGHLGDRRAVHVGEDDHDPQQVTEQIGQRLHGFAGEHVRQPALGVAASVVLGRGDGASPQPHGDLVFGEPPLSAHLDGRDASFFGHPVDRRSVDSDQFLDVLGGEQTRHRGPSTASLYIFMPIHTPSCISNHYNAA